MSKQCFKCNQWSEEVATGESCPFCSPEPAAPPPAAVGELQQYVGMGSAMIAVNVGAWYRVDQVDEARAADRAALKKAQAKLFAVEKVMGWLLCMSETTRLEQDEVYGRLHAAIYSDQCTELSTHDEQRAEIEALRAKVAELDETLKHARAELRTSVSSEVIGARLRDYSFQRCRAELAEQERNEWKAKAEKLAQEIERIKNEQV